MASTCLCTYLNKYAITCESPTKKGGINRFVFMYKIDNFCDHPVINDFDLGQWSDAAQECRVRITPEIIASKPSTSFSSHASFLNCVPDVAYAGVKQIDFKVYEFDELESDKQFWNCIISTPHFYKFGYFDCDGNLFGFFNFGLQISEVIEESHTGLTYKEGTITYSGLRMDSKLVIDTGLIELLESFREYECV